MFKLSWITSIVDLILKASDALNINAKQKFIDDMKLEVALTSIHEEEYETDEVKEIVSRIKQDWSNSPETPSEFVESLMSVFKGQLASLQLKNMVPVDLDKDSPVSKAMFGQLGIITDLSLLASSLSVVGEVLSIGQIDTLGQEMRAYLDYSGLSQITGFGYGMILSNAVSPLMTQEINKQVHPALIEPDRALNFLYRGIITLEDYNENMLKLGYTGPQIAQYNEGYQFYPAATDFIRFAVRDVFDENVVDKWGYDNSFPVQMQEHVSKAGMSMDILKWYWRAHWELPSPTMGFEMLHRGELDKPELEELLRISDYAPGYIDKMIAISYSPYTRVDAKRMFQSGVLSEEDLLTAYTDIGYSREMGENLVSWVKADGMASEKDLTRAMIINAYKAGLIDREVTKGYIQDLGYDGDESELIISLEDNKSEQAEIKETLKVLRIKFVKEIIGSYEFEKRCADMGLSETQTQKEILLALQQKEKTIKLPSKADLVGWIKAGIIEESEFRDKMIILGYQSGDINNYLEALSIE